MMKSSLYIYDVYTVLYSLYSSTFFNHPINCLNISHIRIMYYVQYIVLITPFIA